MQQMWQTALFVLNISAVLLSKDKYGFLINFKSLISHLLSFFFIKDRIWQFVVSYDYIVWEY